MSNGEDQSGDNLDPLEFNKLRRNLLLVSVTLLVIDWLGVSFSGLKEFSFSNQKMYVQNPAGIVVIIWLVWSYCLIRYIACHLDTKGNNTISRAFRNELKDRYIRIVSKKLTKNPIKDQRPFPGPDIQMKSFELPYNYIFRIRIHMTTGREEEHDIRVMAMSVWLAQLMTLTKVIFARTITSQYYLPYLVAFSPVLLLIYKSFDHTPY